MAVETIILSGNKITFQHFSINNHKCLQITVVHMVSKLVDGQRSRVKDKEHYCDIIFHASASSHGSQFPSSPANQDKF